jgi:hypothetical protein
LQQDLLGSLRRNAPEARRRYFLFNRIAQVNTGIIDARITPCDFGIGVHRRLHNELLRKHAKLTRFKIGFDAHSASATVGFLISRYERALDACYQCLDGNVLFIRHSLESFKKFGMNFGLSAHGFGFGRHDFRSVQNNTYVFARHVLRAKRKAGRASAHFSENTFYRIVSISLLLYYTQFSDLKQRTSAIEYLILTYSRN